MLMVRSWVFLRGRRVAPFGGGAHIYHHMVVILSTPYGDNFWVGIKKPGKSGPVDDGMAVTLYLAGLSC